MSYANMTVSPTDEKGMELLKHIFRNFQTYTVLIQSNYLKTYEVNKESCSQFFYSNIWNVTL